MIDYHKKILKLLQRVKEQVTLIKENRTIDLGKVAKIHSDLQHTFYPLSKEDKEKYLTETDMYLLDQIEDFCMCFSLYAINRGNVSQNLLDQMDKILDSYL
jgi:hypothetical protein